VVVIWEMLAVGAAVTLLWLLLQARAAPRRRRTAQRATAARMRLELSQRPEPTRRRDRAAVPLLRSLVEGPPVRRVLPKRTKAV